MHWVDGRLAGFCWTKLHRDTEPVLGEIYIIAVDPAHAGRGLGRSLTAAGLAHLHREGAPLGMLYVDAGNARAQSMYRSLGFSAHHLQQAFVGDVRQR
jgi:mycothiol synthase